MSLSNEHVLLQKIVEENLDELDLLFPMLRGWIPEHAGEARLVRAEFQETRPLESRADIVVAYGEPPTFCIIIEIQRAQDDAKPDAWIAYRRHALRA